MGTRSLLIKVCIAVYVVWFGFVIIFMVQTNNSDPGTTSINNFFPRQVDDKENVKFKPDEREYSEEEEDEEEEEESDVLRFQQNVKKKEKKKEEEAAEAADDNEEVDWEKMEQILQREENIKQEQQQQQQLQQQQNRILSSNNVSSNVLPQPSSTRTTSSATTVPPVAEAETKLLEDPTIERLTKEGLIVPRWYLDMKEVSVISNAPGEFGKAVQIDKEKLSVADREAFDDGFKRNSFNQYASDRISLHRALKDVRDDECKVIKYRERLPPASVIIIFHNEAWTPLLRTIHSVLDRSPPNLIKEIILVDDFSDFDHLKQPLNDYMSKLMKVKIIRSKRREGLIRARLLGAAMATAPILIFLDSHCECTKGWLEPLLDRIAENRSIVVTPIIDVLNDQTLKYNHLSAQYTQIGGFDWSLTFNWHRIPLRESNRQKSPVDPVHTPTMAGGLFAINREYFEYIGTYDTGMDIWGAENLEISFRIWMCGGTVEQVLCSHVGHIFRSINPHGASANAGDFMRKNSVRLAEVWMDDYKKYFYERLDFELGNYGDISSRKELRKRLNCKSFDWYLKNIYPELFNPTTVLASGHIQNKAGRMMNGRQESICLDALNVTPNNSNPIPIGVWVCHNLGGNQHWVLSSNAEIRSHDFENCLEFNGHSDALIDIFKCHGMRGNQEWSYRQDDTLLHVRNNLCLELSEDGSQSEMKPCSGIDRQIWFWQRRKSKDNVELSSRPKTSTTTSKKSAGDVLRWVAAANRSSS